MIKSMIFSTENIQKEINLIIIKKQILVIKEVLGEKEERMISNLKITKLIKNKLEKDLAK